MRNSISPARYDSDFEQKMVLKKHILGLDIGDKRIGVAQATYGKLPVTPLKTLIRAQGRAEKALIELIEKYDIDQVVVGLPLSEDGTKNPQCERVEAFIKRLAKRVQISVHYVDEYLSSEEAKQRLNIPGNPEKEIRKRGMIDALSASIILENYLKSLSK